MFGSGSLPITVPSHPMTESALLAFEADAYASEADGFPLWAVLARVGVAIIATAATVIERSLILRVIIVNSHEGAARGMNLSQYIAMHNSNFDNIYLY